jgi:hypothetical protein
MIVPLSLLALLTGLIQALGTHWGLVKHYWVLTKFALTIAATTLLLMHQFTAVAEAAKRASVATDVGPLGAQLVFDAAAAIAVLLTTTTLSVFKPWGLTGFGSGRRAGEMPLGLRIFLTTVGAIVAGILIVHAAGGGMRGHP